MTPTQKQFSLSRGASKSNFLSVFAGKRIWCFLVAGFGLVALVSPARADEYDGLRLKRRDIMVGTGATLTNLLPASPGAPRKFFRYVVQQAPGSERS